MEKGWIKIFRSQNRQQAEIIKAILLEHDIFAVVIVKQDSSYQLFGENEVYVNEADEQKATEILNDNVDLTVLSN